MDRNEAVLRELNLYPLWQRRGNSEAVGHPAASPLRGQRRDQHAAKSGNTEAGVESIPTVAVDASTSLASSGGEESVGRALARPLRQAQDRHLGLKPDLQSIDWPELKRMVHDCTACGLRAGCTQTVFGVGDEQADWLFVGEGPGADEDALGEPFVGQAGKLLDAMLTAIQLKRGKNVYIANIVKCRPPDNRTPEADEIATCLPYLRRQIALIQPRLIVALGKTAATALLMEPLAIRLGESTTPAKSLVIGKDATLGSLRGTLHDYHGIPLIVTYHPAYLLRSPMEKAKAWQDLCLALQTRISMDR